MMKIIMTIFCLCQVVYGRSLRRTQPKVALYSMETGRHLAISHRRIGSTKKSNSVLAEVEMISVSGSQFIIRGSQTGLYISGNRKLKVSQDKNQATLFSEELIESNQFSSYKIASENSTKDCFLMMRKNGKPKISCHQKTSKTIKNISFLPRRVHQRKTHRGERL